MRRQGGASFDAADGNALEARFGGFRFGGDARHFGQFIVHQAALVGIQALHHQRFACLEHALGLGAGAAQELGLGAGAVVVAVDAHARGVFPLGLDDAVDKVLQVIQAVALLPDEEAGTWAGNHEHRPIFVGGHFDAEGVAQRGEDVGENLSGEGNETFLRVHGAEKAVQGVRLRVRKAELVVRATQEAQQVEEEVDEIQI